MAVQTAGRAVLASGVTVAISLLALLVVPVPALRSMGVAGMLIPLVSVAAVLTLLPALLSSIGPRVDYPRIRHEGTVSRGWTAWARLVVRHRVVAAGAALVMLGLLMPPRLPAAIGSGAGIDSLARSGDRYDALHSLTDNGVGTGALTPVEVLVPAAQAEAAASAAREVDGVQLAVVGTVDGDHAVVDVLPTDATLDSDGAAVVDDIRAAVEATVGTDVGVTGVGATIEDYFSAVYEKFPYVLALVAVITYVLLVRTFRSLLLPLKAVLLNLVSLAAVFGAVVYFWQLGHGSDLLFDVSHRRDLLLAASGDLRVPLRPLDGLRGLHPGEDARGVRPHRRHLDGGDHRDRPDRPAGHLGRTDPVLRLHRPGDLARHRREGPRYARWGSGSSSTPPSSAR